MLLISAIDRGEEGATPDLHRGQQGLGGGWSAATRGVDWGLR